MCPVKIAGSCRWYVLFTYFCSFKKALDVIVKIIEASMCYVGVIDVYYNDNDNDEDDDVVASKLGCASDPSLPPPTPIDGTSPPDRPPNQPTPTIPPPW